MRAQSCREAISVRKLLRYGRVPDVTIEKHRLTASITKMGEVDVRYWAQSGPSALRRSIAVSAMVVVIQVFPDALLGASSSIVDSCFHRSVRVDRRQWGALVAPYFLQCILGVAADGTLALHGH